MFLVYGWLLAYTALVNGIQIFATRLWKNRQYAGATLLKQIRVGPGSFQSNLFIENLVDQNPIRFDVAISVASPVSTEFMIAIFRREWRS